MRIRTVKPEWLEDERMAMASPEARVLSIALIIMADDHGRGRANRTMLSGRVFPGVDNPRETLDKAIEDLARLSFVTLYDVEGQSYYEIRNWTRHQKVDNPSKPRIPAAPPQNCGNIDTRESSRESRQSSRESREILASDRDQDLDPEGTRRGPAREPAPLTLVPESKPKKSKPQTPHDRAMADPRVAEVITLYRELHALADRWRPETREGQQTRAERILRALEGHGRDQLTLDEIKAAIRGNHADEWHRKRGKHELSYVLRSDKVAGFVATGSAAMADSGAPSGPPVDPKAADRARLIREHDGHVRASNEAALRGDSEAKAHHDREAARTRAEHAKLKVAS